MKVYFISGLAADSRMFKKIRLPSHCEAVYLEWILPLANESLQAYSERMAEKINGAEPFAIVGLSMGGMMATEITKKLKPAITILISSIPFSAHLPFYFKMAGAMRLHKIIPLSFVKSAALTKYFFTIETKDDKMTLQQTIRDSDNHFIRWAMGAILEWKNQTPPVPYIHIHGTKDEILPLRFTKPTHIIPQAGHLMIMNRAKEINAILTEALS